MERYNIKLLEAYLKKNKLTKTAFCKKCRISMGTLCRFYKQSGKIRLSTLFKVIWTMKVSAKDFLGF